MNFRVVGSGFLIASFAVVQGVTSQVIDSSSHIDIEPLPLQNETTAEIEVPRLQKCSLELLPQFGSGVVPENVISFVALGDTPYKLYDRHCLNYQMRNIDLSTPDEPSNEKPQFAIHLGDIKMSGFRFPCDEQAYSDVSDIFTHPDNALNYDSRDVFFVVGDNEWVDCSNPAEAWSLWMKYFGPKSIRGFGTLSRGDTEVRRQTKIDGMDRSENFAFFRESVLFIGVNIVGGRERGDESTRLVQNFKWVKTQMDIFSKRGLKAVVIMGHGVLKRDFHYKYYADDLFNLLRKNYKDLPVMYLHGDGHLFCVRYPAPDLNYVDLMVDEGGVANPILVSVVKDPSTDKYGFAVDRRGGLYSPEAGPDDVPDCPFIEETTWNVTLPTSNLKTQSLDLVIAAFPPHLPNTLGECQGHCRSDRDCNKSLGLKCFIRRGFTSVPNCRGKGKKNKNYCFKPDAAMSSPTASPTQDPTITPKTAPSRGPSASPTILPSSAPFSSPKEVQPKKLKLVARPPHIPNSLGLCEGHCKRDEDCKQDEGLYCYRRRNFDPIPFCLSKGRKGKNYCIPRNVTERSSPTSHPSPSPPPNPTTLSPTPNPTALPTPTPTSGHSLGNLVFFGDPQDNPSKFPLSRCEGDCDGDRQCKPGLVCFNRIGREQTKIPGCVGDARPNKDYCYDPKWEQIDSSTIQKSRPSIPPSITPTATPSHSPSSSANYLVWVGNRSESPELFPLGLCEGDCDSDNQCKDTLKCYKRDGAKRNDGVPGCEGEGLPGEDYCYEPRVDTTS